MFAGKYVKPEKVHGSANGSALAVQLLYLFVYIQLYIRIQNTYKPTFGVVKVNKAILSLLTNNVTPWQ